MSKKAGEKLSARDKVLLKIANEEKRLNQAKAQLKAIDAREKEIDY